MEIIQKEVVQFTEEAKETGYPRECCEGQQVRQYLPSLQIHAIKPTTTEKENTSSENWKGGNTALSSTTP